jgi:23S rRNA (guanine745-N1)-methyltransferase
VIGVDIAKPAIQSAAKRFRGVTWLVASGALLPVGDAALDVVTCLFTQLHAAEMHRVLAPGGHLLVATPAPDHLQAIRERLFDEVRPHQPDKFLATLEPQFELRSQQTVRFDLALEGASLANLLTMTPYAWRAKPEKRAALESGGPLSTQAAFTLLLLARR